LSFCQDVMNVYGEHCAPAMGAGPRVGADEEYFLVGDLLVHGHHHVGERDSGDDRHLVLLDQLVDELCGDFRLELAVLLDHLHGNSAQLAAVLLDDHHERVVLVLAERGLRPGQLRHEPDLDRCLRTRAAHRGSRANRGERLDPFHAASSH
jgi:hypothetical protein